MLDVLPTPLGWMSDPADEDQLMCRRHASEEELEEWGSTLAIIEAVTRTWWEDQMPDAPERRTTPPTGVEGVGS